MGIFDRFRSSGLEEEESDDADLIIDDSINELGRVSGKFQGKRISLDHTKSSNGEWIFAFSRSRSDSRQPILLLDSNFNPQWGKAAGQVPTAEVNDEGIVVATKLGEGEGDFHGGELMVIDREGDSVFSKNLDQNIVDCAISEQGDLAAVSLMGDEMAVYIFDVGESRQIADYITPIHQTHLEFGQLDGEKVLFLLDDERRILGITMEGEEIWVSESKARERRIKELLEDGGREELKEATELLKKQLDLVEDENKWKNLSLKAGEANWKLAKIIHQEEGDTDDWWIYLNQAKSNYSKVLDWSRGRDGYAKVQRKQAKYHLKQGNEQAALDLFENISNIGEEYDDRLLTAPNKETMEELREQAD